MVLIAKGIDTLTDIIRDMRGKDERLKQEAMAQGLEQGMELGLEQGMELGLVRGRNEMKDRIRERLEQLGIDPDGIVPPEAEEDPA